MSDQNAADPAAANTPDEGTGATATTDNWQQRYEHLQPEFTRATQDRDRYRQENEQYRQLIEAVQSDDPELRAQAAEILGWELPQEPQQQQYGDTPQDPRFDELANEFRQFRDQQTTREQQAADEAAYQQFLTASAGELAGMGVPEGLHQIIANTALNLADQSGQPVDLNGAAAHVEQQLAAHFAEWTPVQTMVKKGWQKTKPSQAATQPGGVQATHTPSLDTRAARADWISQQLAQAEADG